MRNSLLAIFTAVAASLNLFAVIPADAQPQSTVYFLAAGPRHSQSQPGPSASEYEAFVVPVNDLEQIATIRSLIQRAEYPVVNVHIQAVGDGINRDFYAPGAPAWNWAVTGLISVQGEPRAIFAPCCPAPGELPADEYGSVSMIAADPQAWIAQYGSELNQQWFPLTTEVNPAKPPVPHDPEAPVMANLSSRAITEKGEEILIGGITISGSRPKQVAVKASGNDVLGPLGIGTRVFSPRVRMYSADGTLLHTLGQERSYELAARFPALDSNFGTRAIVTLYPGQYTFHVFDDYDQTGVVLFELYDLSLAPQPFP